MEQLQRLGDEINALLGASRALTEASAAIFHPDLRPAAFHLARWLYAFGPARPSDLSERVAMDRSSTSALLGQMTRLGLIERSASQDDGRSVAVSLSEAGRRRVEVALASRQTELEERITGWPPQQVEAFIQLLRRFNGRHDHDGAV
jgi:DNA-binding MarR family transcriptional regulator